MPSYNLKLSFLVITLALFSVKSFSSEPDSLPPVHIDPGMTEIIRRGPPVNFRGFALKDPSTGEGSEERAKPIAEDALLELPNGKKLPARQYYDEINKLEKDSNPFGYSFRHKEKNLEYGRIKLNHQEFQEKRTETIAKHDFSKIRIRRPIEERRKWHEEEVTKHSDFLKNYIRYFPPTNPAQPKPFKANRWWNNSWGWSNKFAAFAGATVSLDGNSENTSAHADGNAGGFIFGHRLNIVNGTANFETPKTGNLKGDVSFYVLGIKLLNKNYNKNVSYFYNTKWSKGLDKSTTIHFALGPIPMSATVGARGEASLAFRMGLVPLRANSDIDPGVGSKVYIQVGVDVIVGGAGGGSDLVLINDTLVLHGKLHVLLDNLGPYYESLMSADNYLNTLSGRVYAYVFIYLPAFAIPPWEKHQWDWTLFKLDGITAKGSVFNVGQKLYLL